MSEEQAPKSTAYTRTLRLAAETLGGAKALAERLRVEAALVEGWIAGKEYPPHEMFLRALDIVAGGPLYDAAAVRNANKAQQHADRIQASANRARESAERVQRSADLAQQRANERKEQVDPGKTNDSFRQINPKDGAPASNKEDDAKKKSDAG